RNDHRGRVAGVAHGFSSSGQTVFVEPLETIEGNNELQNLRETEEREIARILSTLTEELRRELPAIERAARAVAELDFINAKAVMARTFDCVEPLVSDDDLTLELVKARHPLLEENLRQSGGAGAVVPSSFTLEAERPVMVISGANAGGKTVVLKTAGLLSLMALSGLHVPAETARVPLYRAVLADIGDSQSLAANLSTFTAHVANISRMIGLCRRPALVLLDEVGTGTDPEEGSALGVAVVDHFRRRCGAHVIATTHYSGLKHYAANEPGVLNASVEFNEKTLEPTYRLLVGLAGASSGIDIARRFGFPREIVEDAAAHVDESAREAAEYLKRIKREAEEAEALRRALEEERAAVADKYAGLEREAQRRETERQREFERELRAGVADFERRTQELISQIEDRAVRLKVEREAERRAAELRREAQKHSNPSRPMSQPVNQRGDQQVASGIRVVRQGQEEAAREIASMKAAGGKEYRRAAEQRDIAQGDTVRLRSFGKVGTVERLGDGEAEVRVGSLRLREKVGNLELVELVPAASAKSGAGARGVGRLEQMAAPRTTQTRLTQSKHEPESELNLIGRTTDEAADALDKFLDEAFLHALSIVRVIHGHGTGALRRAVHEHLRGHPHVGSFTQAPPEQGGAGATVVELKQ
ncbi:MAG: endonuclease MutS2, partial [Pyrinomonadaceae bacterium]